MHQVGHKMIFHLEKSLEGGANMSTWKLDEQVIKIIHQNLGKISFLVLVCSEGSGKRNKKEDKEASVGMDLIMLL